MGTKREQLVTCKLVIRARCVIRTQKVNSQEKQTWNLNANAMNCDIKYIGPRGMFILTTVFIYWIRAAVQVFM